MAETSSIGSGDSSSSASFGSSDSSSGLDQSNDSLSHNTSIENYAQSPTTEEQLASQKSPLDTVADIGSQVGAANVGFNAPLTGVHIGNVEVVSPSMQFGRYAPNSVSPTAGYNITQFSRTDNFFASYMARQTMVSSQASYEYAKSVDPSLSNTVFEASSPVDATRSYDVHSNNAYTEVKAGKSITPSQLAKDVDLAKTGQAVDYVFTGNPITGNHGPDARVSAKLADAMQETGGKLTTTVADITPSARQMDAVVDASRLTRVARGAGKVLGPAALALDVYTIGSAVQKDGGTFGENTKVAVAETAGGWAGAASGGYVGAKGGAIVGAMVGGPAGAAIGAVVGGAGGAIAGAISGSWLGNTVSGWF